MGDRDHYVENIEEKMHYTLIITIKVTKEKETHTDTLAVDVIKPNKHCIGGGRGAVGRGQVEKGEQPLH